MNYGKAFRVIRAAFGLSQADLARLLRLGQSHISLIEAGKRQPSLEALNNLSNALRIPQALILLLASDPMDLQGQNRSDIEALAISLLKLLVSASDEAVQQPLPLEDTEEPER